MKEFLEELKYNQNINFEKGLENRIDIDYVIERLENIYDRPYFNVSRCEVESAMEDIMNDELWMNDAKALKRLENMTEEEINTLAWKVCDEDVWNDIYGVARSYVLEEITKEEK